MPALQIKDCPQDTYEQLKLVAAAENRSISQQMLTILQEYLKNRSSFRSSEESWRDIWVPEERSGVDYVAKRKRAIERLNELPRFGLPDGYTNAADLVHDAREERW